MNSGNILTPIDFSVNSVRTFDYAVRYSQQHNTTLHLLHVVDPSFYTDDSGFTDEFMWINRLQNANEELKKFVNEIPHPGVKIIENLRTGKPYQEIIKYSEKNKIDLIIIGSHGWTGDYSLNAGSVAEKVIELSRVPVICLKTNASVLSNENIIIEKALW